MFDLAALGFPAGTVLSVRDALLAIVVLLAVYILAVVLRYRRLRRQAEAEAEAASESVSPEDAPAAPVAKRAEAGPATGARLYAAVQETAPPSVAPVREQPREPAVAPAAPVILPRPINLAAEVADTPVVQAIERDLTQLRQEIVRLQGELAVVQDEMRERFAQLQATQHMSPLYSDAMQMAAAGHDAQTIADRCNIARAEADLVVALVRNQGGG